MALPPRTIPRSRETDAGAERSSSGEGGSGFSSVRIRLGRAFRSENPDYFLLAGTTIFLVLFGFVMVLSSSSVESYDGSRDFFSVFIRQGAFVLLGIPAMLLASRLPQKFWMAVAWPALAASCFLQLLVVATPLGIEVGGNTNWLSIAGFQFQPSEVIKLALVIWLGLMVTRKEAVLGEFKRGLLPILLVGGAAIGLVMLGGDLGTVVIMAISLLGALYLIGVKLRLLVIPVLVGIAGMLALAIASPNRVTRILAFFEDGCTDYENTCWQSTHGTFALANGGFFGVGLGNSQSKWMWLPAADNDYIFAIIGEELGLVGAVVVLVLFVLLAVSFSRILRRARTPFGRAATAFVAIWIVAQAFVNMGVVLGVLPVLGVPLPLISSGGTALVSGLLAIGIVLSVARESPEVSK